MKKMVKVSMEKFKNDDMRWLVYNFDFKTEEIADNIIEKLEEKFNEFDYDWKFARCPWIDENTGVYGDSVSVEFVNGYMAEIKKDMRIMFDEVMNEMGIK